MLENGGNSLRRQFRAREGTESNVSCRFFWFFFPGIFFVQFW